MDVIYEGAEFTIVAAVGNARKGLLDVTRPRKPQQRVELKKYTRTASGALVNNLTASAPNLYFELLGITKEEYKKTCRDRRWLDIHRHELRSNGKIDLSRFIKDQEIMEDFADDFENLIDK
ncbi:hypothetical protein MMC14_006237 [Varicellaria rhodocarpa]|nr:hypothetical protein [Varicellaria rhodocarpa]